MIDQHSVSSASDSSIGSDTVLDFPSECLNALHGSEQVIWVTEMDADPQRLSPS